jgi:alkylation response protein AidB-like acyl-CoA dehydrogenase
MPHRSSFEAQSLRELVRDFAARELAPIADRYEAEARFPVQLLRPMGELGLLAIGHRADAGGLPGGLAERCIVIEELARVNAGVASTLAGTAYVVPAIIAAVGTAAQIERYVRPLISGKAIATFALTEPDSGSDVRGIRTRAERDGDAYVVSGTKMFASSASIADFAVVVAYTDASEGIDGMSMFIVDRATPGYEHVAKLDKQAIRTCETSIVALDACRVPIENRLGDEGTAFRRVMSSLAEERMYNWARSLGIATASFEAAMTYAMHRRQFGKPIGAYQAIAFKLADMAVKLDAARLLGARACELRDAGMPATTEISMAKLFASEICVELAREAVQIHGGYGVMSDFPVARYMQDSLLGTIGAGTSEIQRRIIARQLGLPVS